jgi:AcrR family transcriptional regulator
VSKQTLYVYFRSKRTCWSGETVAGTLTAARAAGVVRDVSVDAATRLFVGALLTYIALVRDTLTATRLGVPLELTPGWHVPQVTEPHATAALLRRLLESSRVL